MTNYQEYLNSKNRLQSDSGINISENKLNDRMFDFQKRLTAWALRKGCACLFEDCGLGKSIQLLEWSRHIVKHENKPVIVLSPLAVSKQTKRESDKFGIDVKTKICESQSDVITGINITNYEKIHKFDMSKFIGVVIDESSIIKNYSGKIRNQIIKIFKKTKYRLSCTATPSPNDYMELGNQSEFLGIMTRAEMLAKYFTHDGGDTSKWRLRGYADDKFWQWLCSWAVYIRKPSDIGFDDGKYILPPLNEKWHIVKPDEHDYSNGMLFPVPAETLSERRSVRKKYIADRVQKAHEIVDRLNGHQLLFWCDLNPESDAIRREFEAIEVKGSDHEKHKEESILAFASGQIKRLVTKPSIAGFGVNWQKCHNMIFIGLSDSYESRYQAIRRCWRFGQENAVNSHTIYHELEGNVISNINRKEKQANKMAENLLHHMEKYMNDEVKSNKQKTITSDTKNIRIPPWI